MLRHGIKMFLIITGLIIASGFSVAWAQSLKNAAAPELTRPLSLGARNELLDSTVFYGLDTNYGSTHHEFK